MLSCPDQPLWALLHLPQHAPASRPCLSFLAAAATLDTCSTVVANATVDCSLQLYVGFSGDDKNSVTFNSGWMLQRINAFSVATLYNNALQAVRCSAQLLLKASSMILQLTAGMCGCS